MGEVTTIATSTEPRVLPIEYELIDGKPTGRWRPTQFKPTMRWQAVPPSKREPAPWQENT